ARRDGPGAARERPAAPHARSSRTAQRLPLSGTRRDELAQLCEHGRIGVELAQQCLHARRTFVGECAGAVFTELRDVAVAVQQVVHDLEEEAELAGTDAPPSLLRLRHAGDPERTAD